MGHRACHVPDQPGTLDRAARARAAAKPRRRDAGRESRPSGRRAPTTSAAGRAAEPRSDRAAALPAGRPTRRATGFRRRWPYLILTMIAAIGSCMVATRGLPGR